MMQLLRDIENQSGGTEKAIVFSQVSAATSLVQEQQQEKKSEEGKRRRRERLTTYFTITFVQFTSFLDLIEPFLKKEGMKYVRCESTFN